MLSPWSLLYLVDFSIAETVGPTFVFVHLSELLLAQYYLTPPPVFALLLS